jgi:fermentation-respiration switch protein FrsA (DUF1100 family)
VLLATILACYLAVLFVLLILEDQLLFRPKRGQSLDWQLPPANLAAENVWLQTADGTSIHGWWCFHPGAKGAVLFCHGNSGNVSYQGQTVLALTQALGQSVLVFDYPGFGRSGGRPSEAGCYAAGDAAYDWLAQQVPPARILLLGQSLGGGVAVDLASRRPHCALALFKTFTSIPDVAQKQFPFLPARWLVHNHFDNLEKIRRCSGPILIAHGDRDHLIPLSQARRLFQASPEPKRFLQLNGCGHHGTIGPDFLTSLAALVKS